MYIYCDTFANIPSLSASHKTAGSEESKVADDNNDFHGATDDDGNSAHEATVEMTETSQPAATAAKKATKKTHTSPDPPAKKIALYHIDTRDTSVVAYYHDNDISYAEATVYINGVIPKGKYRFSMSLNGMLILWQRNTHKRCFYKKLLQAIMGSSYSLRDSRVITYDNFHQEMHGSKVTPNPSNLY